MRFQDPSKAQEFFCKFSEEAKKRYSSLIISIAADKSIEYGYGGYMFGFAANSELLKHYIECFDADFIGIRHPYHFMIDDVNASRIREVYDYEWTDAKI